MAALRAVRANPTLPMILIPFLSLVGHVALPAAAPTVAVVAEVRSVPQGYGSVPATGRGGALPGGGTPEPTSVLLLVGGAVGYGVHRLLKARGRSAKGE